MPLPVPQVRTGKPLEPTLLELDNPPGLMLGVSEHPTIPGTNCIRVPYFRKLPYESWCGVTLDSLVAARGFEHGS